MNGSKIVNRNKHNQTPQNIMVMRTPPILESAIGSHSSLDKNYSQWDPPSTNLRDSIPETNSPRKRFEFQTDTKTILGKDEDKPISPKSQDLNETEKVYEVVLNRSGEQKFTNTGFTEFTNHLDN